MIFTLSWRQGCESLGVPAIRIFFFLLEVGKKKQALDAAIFRRDSIRVR